MMDVRTNVSEPLGKFSRQILNMARTVDALTKLFWRNEREHYYQHSERNCQIKI